MTELGLPADATVVGAVGRLTYQKAPEDFLAALRALGRPEVTGLRVGGGELAPRVAAQARQLPDVRVVLAGERAHVPELLPAFDVFALPSRYECARPSPRRTLPACLGSCHAARTA
ncbi:MAG TPA: glycosyltransferase [Streptosporangiaceae bacterium]|nr:glycosyltransferase [Streptosporangiaceae bacterium]